MPVEPPEKRQKFRDDSSSFQKKLEAPFTMPNLVGKWFTFPRRSARKYETGFKYQFYTGPPDMDPPSIKNPKHILRVDLDAKYKIEAVYETRKWMAFQFKVRDPSNGSTYKVWTNARKRNEYWLRECLDHGEEDEEPACPILSLVVDRLTSL